VIGLWALLLNHAYDNSVITRHYLKQAKWEPQAAALASHA